MIAVLDGKLTGAANVKAISGLLGPGLRAAHPVLQQPFDLIVASSVCTFLPDFGEQLKFMAQLLRPGGLFVHWDWHAGAEDWATGFTVEQVASAYETASLNLVSCGVAFNFAFGEKSYEVLMGVARR